MKDIAPELLETIQSEFNEKVRKNQNIKILNNVLEKGKANYKDANSYALELGDALSNSFQNNLSASILPDGKMHYNIADRVIKPTMQNNYNMISEYTTDTQKQLNQAANLNINAVTPELNQDRIDGIIDRVSNESNFDDIKWILGEPVINFSQAIIDDFIKANSEFHYKLGLQPRITRTSTGKCCKWCSNMVGTYTYPYDVPKDVYRRHRSCRCQVLYNPMTGKNVQNVYSKKWIKPGESARIEGRKQAKINKLVVENNQFGKKAGKHMNDYGLDPSNSSDREKFENIILDISNNHDRIIRDIEWRGQNYPCTAYVKGSDVVLVNKDNEFITIMKGGINNERIKNQRRR